MADLTLRNVKNVPLTNQELDDNFTNLNDDKLESSEYTASDVLTKVKTVDGTGSGLDADLLDGNESTAFATSAQGDLADSALQNLVEDSTPQLGGNLDVNGFTVDGRNVSSDGSKLDGIEANATADQTAGEIKTAYESNADTNAFTDAEQSKLSGIEANADVTDTANVTAAGALMDSEVANLAQVKAFDSADYATAAQGDLADTALQDGDTVSSLAITSADINGGTIDGVTIGGASAGAGTFTTLQANTSLNVDGTVTADGLTVDSATSTLRNTSGVSLDFVDQDASVSEEQVLANIDFYSTPIAKRNSYIESRYSGPGGAGILYLGTGDGGGAKDRVSIGPGGDISFYEDTGTTPKLYWDASAERLGIGTTSPTAKLDVVGAAGLLPLQVSHPGNQSFGTVIQAKTVSGTDDPVISLENYNGGSPVRYGISCTDDGSMAFLSGAYSGAFGTERMRITSSGDVGIGTSSPSLATASGSASGLEINGSVPAINLNAGSSDEFLIYGGSSNANILVGNNNPLRILTGGSEAMRIDSSGNLLVGKTTPTPAANGVELRPGGTLIASGGGDAGIFYRKTASAGSGVILTKSDVGGTETLVGAGFANGTFGVVSDANKKKNIESARNYLDDITQLRVVKYNWVTDEDGTSKELGWIAQEVEQVFPGMITEMGGNKLLKKEIFLPMLMKCIQELKAELDTVKAEIQTLKGA